MPGIAQAEEVAAKLAASGLRFQRAVSSDLCRARQTAEILAAACSGDGGAGARELRFDPRLRECSLGKFEGMKRDDIKGPNGQYRSLFEELVRALHIGTTYLCSCVRLSRHCVLGIRPHCRRTNGLTQATSLI